MASHVQSTGTTFDNVTNFSVALPSDPATGHLIVVGAARYRVGDNSRYDSANLTKSAGTATITTPRMLQDNFSNELANAVWSCLVTAGGTLTLQVAHNGGSTFGSMFLATFSGNFLNPNDTVYRLNVGTSTTPDSTSFTPVRIGDNVWIGQFVATNVATPTVTADGAWTLIGEDENGTDRQMHSLIYRIANHTVTDSASWTIGQSVNWSAGMLIFSEGGEYPARMFA